MNRLASYYILVLVFGADGFHSVGIVPVVLTSTIHVHFVADYRAFVRSFFRLFLRSFVFCSFVRSVVRSVARSLSRSWPWLHPFIKCALHRYQN